MANPKQKKVQNALIQIINDLGVNAVSLWRSSLKSLSLLESIKGETPNEISSSLGNMFDDTLKLPGIKTHDVAEFVTQKEAIGGFKFGVDLLSNLLGKIGGEMGLMASINGISKFLFEFQETAMDSVD